MKAKVKYTSILLSRQAKKELGDLGKFGDSYERIILRLIEKSKEERNK